MSLKDLKAKTQSAADFAVEHKPVASSEPRRLVTGPAAQAFSNDTVVEYKRKAAEAEAREAGARSKLTDAENRLLGTESRLAEFDGARPARLINPVTIRPSQWANRHPSSFFEDDFLALKADVESASGNVQAIKVRPIRALAGGGLSSTVGSDSVGGQSSSMVATEIYEIVFGHRRHRACLELGLPVLAVVEDVSDQQLFSEMDRENRDRKDLSAWEQGVMYARALSSGLYPSKRKLAESIGRAHTDVNQAVLLAELPKPVVDVFASPLELQFRWAKHLTDAREKDEGGLIARATDLKGKTGDLTAKEIFERLVGGEKVLRPAFKHENIVVKSGRKAVATVTQDAKGKTAVRFESALDKSQRQELAKLISEFMAR